MKRNIDFLKQNIIAHRGYHNIEKGIPENSLKAFEEAIKKNYIIELDVHILKDGEIIVFHDDNLKRMTGTDRKIKDLCYNEIKKSTLLNTNQKIPLLKEVLELVNGKVPIIIEIKNEAKVGKLEKSVINILKNYNGKYAIKSFNPLTVNYFRKNSPETIRGQLATYFRNGNMPKIKKLFLSYMLLNFITKPDFISYDIRELPRKRITNLRKKKLILGWTIKNEEDLKKAKKYCDNYICEGFEF